MEGELSPGSFMALRRLLGIAGLVVGFDDARDEVAPDHVAGVEPDGLNSLHAAQQPDRLLQPRLLPRRQVDLAGIAGDGHLGAVADAGEEHLHLHRCAVLRLVEDHERVRESAAAHERERRDLDGAAQEIALHLRGGQHVVEGIIERAQVGVDLFAHVAGKKAQPLARLDGGAGEHDALHLPALQALGGVGDSKVGLARPGGPEPEDEVGVVQRADVGALVGRARRDHPAPGADLREIVLVLRLALAMPQETVDVARADVLTAPHARVELLQHLPGGGAGLSRPDQRDDVAVGVRLDVEAVLDEGEMPVVFAEEAVQVAVVLKGHHHARLSDLRRLARVRCRRPAYARQLGNLPVQCRCPNPRAQT